MTCIGPQSMSHDPQILPVRLGRYLAKLPAKEVARIARCDIRTAENIKRGQNWPIARHWLGLVATFGEDLTEAVFHPEKANARLAREIYDLEQTLAAKRAALVGVQGDSSGLAETGARTQDRTAEVARWDGADRRRS